MGTKHKKTRVAEATIAHRYTMDRMLDKKLAPPLRKVYKKELDKLQAALQVSFAARGQLPVGPGHIREVRAILAARAPKLAKQLSGQLVDQTRDTQVEAVRSLARFMGALKPEGSVLDDHAIAEKLMKKGRRDLKDQRFDVGQRVALDISLHARKALQDLPKDLKVGDLAQHVSDTVASQWWQVERAMRTETSRAFNETQDNAFNALADEFPGLYKRWTELVNDLTGAPLDARVGQDSLLLHGQIAKPGGLFHMPSTSFTPSGMIGKTWSSPPNRPNDRAVLTPWHEGCGVPAWIMRGGERVNLL